MPRGRLSWLALVTLRVALAGAAQVTTCGTGGYSSAQLAMVSSFPAGTVTHKSRTQLECSASCAQQQQTCLQLYYNATAGSCYLIPSIAKLAITASSAGILQTTPNPTPQTGRSCRSVQCSSENVCVTDCSTTFGGAMCAADNTQCGQGTDIINIKHYYNGWYEDDQDNGVVHTVSFNKTRGDTALRIMWYSTTRAHYHATGQCGRYYVTFNGTACSNPFNIDFSNYDGSSTDHKRFSEVDGMCLGLPAGVVNVSIVVGACPSWSVSDSFTGWHASRSMWVYELFTASSTAYAQCLALPIFNTQYYSVSGPNSGAVPDNQLMATTYTKIASDTALRVKWLGTARVAVSVDGYCARWYIMVNGAECNPKAEFVLGMYTNSSYAAQDNHKTRTLEGICYGLPAGTYTVQLRIGACQNATAQPNPYTGWCGSASRMIITEVRMNTTTQAVTKADGSVFKLPFFNIQHWWWYLLNSDTDVGNLLVVTYNKLSDTSGLHLRTIGDARIFGNSGCCRWYFTINGAECTDPGAIEGVSYTEIMVDYHNPGVIDGVCYGLTSGSYSIEYNVGTCSEYDVFDCYTGWGSTLHLIVDEVQPDSRETCVDPFTCP